MKWIFFGSAIVAFILATTIDNETERMAAGVISFIGLCTSVIIEKIDELKKPNSEQEDKRSVARDEAQRTEPR